MLKLVLVSVLIAGFAGCDRDPVAPSGPGPGAPNIGTLVYSSPEISFGASLAWIDQGEHLVFRSWDGEKEQIKMLAVSTGEASPIEAASLNSAGGRVTGDHLLHMLVADSAGGKIYYVDFAGDYGTMPMLRGVALAGGDSAPFEPRNSGWGGLALATNGSQLAYHGYFGTLVALDLGTMETTEVQASNMLAFSPTGSELLVWDDEGLVRAHLAEGTTERLDLEAPRFKPLTAHWDESGIRVLAAEHLGTLAAFTFASGTGPVARFPLEGTIGSYVGGGVLAPQGDRFAIWTERCVAGAGAYGGCGALRVAVHVGRFETGELEPVGSDESEARPALTFSPDGSRLYYSLAGRLFFVDLD